MLEAFGLSQKKRRVAHDFMKTMPTNVAASRILQELRESEGITANTWVEHQRQKNRKRSAEIVADDEEVLDLLSDSEDDVH